MSKFFLLILSFCLPALLLAQDSTLVEGFNGPIGGWQPGTINGFGVDKAEFYLSDDAQEGLLSLAESVSSNSWGAGFQVILADTNGMDWSAYDSVSFWHKADMTSLKSVVMELFSKEDDEQWQYKSTTVLNEGDWAQLVMGKEDSNFVEVAGIVGDGAIDWSKITKINFIFHNNGDFNTVLCQVDNLELFGADTLSVENFNANLGGWAAGTINGFGVDKVNFYLSDDAYEGTLSLVEKVSSNSWGAGFQIILSDTNGMDWSASKNLSYYIKSDIETNKNVHIELFSKEDDEQWAHETNFSLTTDWHQALVNLDTADFVEVAGITGDGTIDWSKITKINLIVLNNGDFNDVTVYFDEIMHGDIVNSIERKSLPIVNQMNLAQNYPNPFNPTTTIEFEVTGKDMVSLDIFNITGQKVATLVNDNLQAGLYTATWNGRDVNGQKVASGVYFYTLRSGQKVQSKRMILIK